MTTTGDTALHLAARRHDTDMVRILVDYGANVDTQNGEGQTALHIAAAEGDEALVKYFYGVRASPHVADNHGRIFTHFFFYYITDTIFKIFKIELQCIWQLKMDTRRSLRFFVINLKRAFTRERKMEVH